MDGVVIDSMVYHYKAWSSVLKNLGINISKTELYKREGEKGYNTIRYFAGKYNTRLSGEELEKILKEKEKIFKKISRPELFPGISEILDFLKNQKLPLGLVTGTSYDEVLKILPEDIFKKFDIKVTGDMLKKGKPDPEAYLLASEMLNIKPDKCLVIENAPYGITSAKNAGMTCIAICTSLEEYHLAAADKIILTFKELKDFLTGIQFEKPY